MPRFQSGQEYDEQRLRRERRKENKRKMVGGTQPRRTNVSMGKKNESSSEDKDEKDGSLSSPSFADQMKNCATYKLLSPVERQLCASIHMNRDFISQQRQSY
ncbi:Transcriptional adapter 2-beta [Desmophyllum pertusum]|uniref:Transcriptional adapter 2-beta n=1 Tax=Desmophyllum pertusum TaxID=174260 RepID=A0A9W9YV03_9CNID|nr:Transcriptional adapter 2-beta [Desmophyllum pertusum]